MPRMTGLTLQEWKQHYHQQADRVGETLGALLASLSTDDPAWIALATPELLQAQIAALLPRYRENPDALPLFGVPFAVKDNIDVAGWPTSAACPAFTYLADNDATAVAKLKAAGAIVIGKTNLDQFATGLVGTRSPFGEVPNTFNADYVSGGSSSGSASVLARGLVAFSLGTDTAGSGRVPAGFNNIVGLKPTKGWLSASGVVPACRLNDTISVFALTVEDAFTVAELAGGYDAMDAYSRSHPSSAPAALSATPRFAIPSDPTFFADAVAQAAWQHALVELEATGATLHPIDFSIFTQLAEQLYQGPWVAERTVAVGDMLRQPENMDPVVHGIVASGERFSAVEAFKAEYLRAELTRQIQQTLASFDALVVPTSPTIHTREAMKQEPVRYNSQLGAYTNFTNLADLSALALPAPFRTDGLPAGITLIAPAWHDRALASFGLRWQAQLALTLGATGKTLPVEQATLPPSTLHVRLAVVGAHLTGMPLNHQLTRRDAVRVEETRTAENYRLYALANTQPAKPGLAKSTDGAAIIVELWDIPLARFGEFVAEIPAPLGIGTLTLSDGRQVKGFICEPAALSDAVDITEFGGWRNWLARQEASHV
ncbi:allophanate hydrolase [Pectobacterium aroidearum]|uniref:Allophanate hydrolase n=1 Tax=Pectobacterium aroidearum TaxID=1201031 RepID=A0ABR5Z9E0_9GAMM|nr:MULTISPECIES: allophanate hydrolase [Pectobacterium]MBA5198359.1 allophanate hydrolase [Pectobacterium aroidearum]MBA5227137.1 allophanate hydrolase [Pectobacterium aroidearum]MBA5231152.1 allophanate hydrolase [Pectobacterium aroidearum]MBA5736298.1 allophanate hydrolase [Pectobacterium aroidearum]UXK02436.1 allophanate hydrolase [Pectobacterium aroidearum]